MNKPCSFLRHVRIGSTYGCWTSPTSSPSTRSFMELWPSFDFVAKRLLKQSLLRRPFRHFSPTTTIMSQQYRNIKFKKHSTLMLHLLLVEKHQQLLLKNTESRPAREVHTMTTQHADVAKIMVEAHAAKASRRPPRGSYRESQPSHMAREMRACGKRGDSARRDQPRPRVN